MSDEERKSPRRPSGSTGTFKTPVLPPPGIAEESKIVEMTKIEKVTSSGDKYSSLSCETSTEIRKQSQFGRGMNRVKKRNSHGGAITMKKILSQEKGDGDAKKFMQSKVYEMVRNDNMSILHIAALNTAKVHLRNDQERMIKKYGNYVLIPGTKMFICWDLIVIVSILFTVIYAPLQIVLKEPYGTSDSASFYIRFIVDRLIDLVFLMDVALNFRTAKVTSSGAITFDAEITARKYLRGRFLFDLIVAWPWDMMVFVILGGNHAEGTRGTSLWLRTPRLVKLFRLNRFMSISERWEHTVQLSYRATNGLFIFGMYIFIIHLIACCWILASGIYDEVDSWVETLAPNDVSTQYSIAVYWAITTLTTIGYGDLTPVLGNNLEMWFTLCVMFVGALFYAFVVGKITEYVRNKHSARSHFESKVQNLKSYMKYFPNLPQDLKERIYRYCLYIRQTEKVKYKRNGLDLLSPALRQELALFCHVELMSESPMFNAVSTSIVSEASTYLKPVLYGPDELVVCTGDVSKNMYFVSDGAMLRETSRGRVNVIHRSNISNLDISMRKLIKLTDRLCFGDGNVVFERASQRETIITLTFTNLLALNRDEMMRIWYRNPYDWEDAKSALARCLWKEILTSGAFTKSAGLRTTSSWRSLSRSPGRNAFRVISKSGSPHRERASTFLDSHEKRRRSTVRRPKSFRKRPSTSPRQLFNGALSPPKSLSPRSPHRRFDLLNHKCDAILQALRRLDKRITSLEIGKDEVPPPPPTTTT